MALPDVMRRSLNYLTLEQEFFASLLFEMRLIEVTVPPARILGRDLKDDSIPFAMGTDGRRIFWNRKFIESVNVPVCSFALVHEVCHPMLLHLTRIYEHGLSGPNWTPKQDTRGRLISRDPALWNVAGDYIINCMLKNSGFTLWDKCLYDPKYDMQKGWTTEMVYNDLLQQAKDDPNSLAAAALAASGTGYDLVEPSADTDLEAEAEEMKDRIIRAATIAKSRGKLPAGMENLIKEYTEPQYPVWLLLERYVDSVLRDDDSSWRRPHQTFMNSGIIMPGPYSEAVSRVDLWYDTSGSVSDDDISRFHRVGGDIIRNAAPATLAVGQCDADVKEQNYIEVKRPTDWPSEIKITGRGGTSFKPPFEFLRERNIRPSLMIYLTDLEGDFPSEPPPFPVIWVSTTDLEAPFGTTIHLNGK